MSVNRAVTGAERDISSLSPRDQYEGQNTLANLQALRDEARRGPVSAERLKDYLDKFNYANSGDAVPNAGLSAQAQVNSLLNRPGMTGVAGAPAVAAGRDASSRAFAGKTMDDWMTQAGLPKGSGSAAFPGRARAELANNPQFYGPGETQALKNLAATGPNVGSGNHFISPWLIRHAVAYPVAGAAIGAAHSALSDDSSAEHIPWWQEALVGAGLVGAHTAAKGMLANRARTQAFNNTRYTLTTGKTPQSTPLQDMIRAGVFGQGATGQN
jgi:hypothetical protein